MVEYRGMKFGVCLLALCLVWVTQVSGGQEQTKYSENALQQEIEVVQYTQYCYSCSSETVMCREAVYDGQYLTSVPCKSSCFLREENNVTYRGCFDGWMGGMVRNNYHGCQKQIYFGKAVEWCFCSSSGSGLGEPCNGQSRETIVQLDNSYGNKKPYYNYAKSSGGDSGSTTYGANVAKSGYDTYPEEYPYINKEADKYQDAKDALYSCKGKKDGTYSDPSDCNRYYQCSNGYSYHMRCSKGTQWNQVLRACAFSFHPMYPCKQTAFGYDVTSYPYDDQEQVGNYGDAQLNNAPQKDSNDLEEFYHYF